VARRGAGDEGEAGLLVGRGGRPRDGGPERADPAGVGVDHSNGHGGALGQAKVDRGLGADAALERRAGGEHLFADLVRGELAGVEADRLEEGAVPADPGAVLGGVVVPLAPERWGGLVG
jgi:hypothetical protein